MKINSKEFIIIEMVKTYIEYVVKFCIEDLEETQYWSVKDLITLLNNLRNLNEYFQEKFLLQLDIFNLLEDFQEDFQEDLYELDDQDIDDCIKILEKINQNQIYFSGRRMDFDYDMTHYLCEMSQNINKYIVVEAYCDDVTHIVNKTYIKNGILQDAQITFSLPNF